MYSRFYPLSLLITIILLLPTPLGFLNYATLVTPEATAQTDFQRKAEAHLLTEQGMAQLQVSQYQEALQSWQQALTIYREIEERLWEGITLIGIGKIYYLLGQYKQSWNYYQQALTISKEIAYPAGEVRSLNNLGLICHHFGQYGQAIDYYQQALAISNEIDELAGKSSIFNNLGAVYRSLGQYGQAIDYYQQALSIKRIIDDPAGEGTTLNNLGVVYDLLGQYDQAIDYYQQALSIKRIIGDPAGESSIFNNLGAVYRSLGQYRQAIDYYQQALSIKRIIGDPAGEGTTLNNLGVVYDLLGQYDQAINYYQQALAISREIDELESEGNTLHNIGLMLIDKGRYGEAEEKLFAAIAIWKNLRIELIDDRDRVSLFETQINTYQNLQQVLVVQGRSQKALEIAEQGRAQSLVQLLAERRSPQLEPIQKLPPLTLQDIQSIAAQQKATLVEYSIIPQDGQLYIWVIQPSGQIDFRQVPLKSLESLAKLVVDTRSAIGVRSNIVFVPIEPEADDEPSPLLRELEQLLIEPIADLLPTDPDARVIFMPQGPLFLVPFPALRNAEGKYLIERHTILTSPSIQTLQLTRKQHQQLQQSARKQVLVLGNPKMPLTTRDTQQPLESPLRPLPGAEQEAEEIASVFSTTKAITGAQGTKATIVARMLSSRIIHLATHGLLDERQGLGSAIALAPSGDDSGWLTADEIFNMELQAELVVLSACNTGRGKITGEGVIGLSRSFISAGVPSLVVSLWSVPDAPTAELMTQFYKNLEGKKMDKARALRQAMLTTMDKHPHPRQWAAFTLIGETD